MHRFLVQIMLCLHLLSPDAARAEAPVKDPLAYPLRQYGFILGMAVFGGVVSWYARVRRGEVGLGSLSALLGELATSALSGLIAFYVCEWAGAPPLLEPAIVGIAGHMGARGIALAEHLAQGWLERRAGKETP